MPTPLSTPGTPPPHETDDLLLPSILIAQRDAARRVRDHNAMITGSLVEAIDREDYPGAD